MLFTIATNRLFRDGVALDCSARLPHPPAGLDGITEIRVLPNGTIERYSESDWAWKPAPELQAYVDDLHKAYDSVLVSQAAAALAAALAASPAPAKMPVDAP